MKFKALNEILTQHREEKFTMDVKLNKNTLVNMIST